MEHLGVLKSRQIKAARALLDWSQDDLAEKSELSVNTIRQLEMGHISPRGKTTSALRRAFEDSGLEFLEPDGVRHKLEDICVFHGREGFEDFFDYVYLTAKQTGHDICVSGVDENLFVKYQGDFSEYHMSRMADLAKQKPDLNMRILIVEGDYNFVASRYASYRWQPKELFSPTAFYVFGDCLALISFEHDPAPFVVLIKSAAFAEAYRHSFNLAWAMARVPMPKEALGVAKASTPKKKAAKT